MSSCPYSDEELDRFDGVSNPMGEACSDCDDLDCEHNPNPNYADGYYGEPDSDGEPLVRDDGDESE